ncbi:LytTR family DNA-binding domain-containing protein [Sporosarcina pasteurii]|uniref:Sensory transduction protein lytR n=1 Tax=Sporosarcina pasteurii TaxID=1474 RepID=A0A380BTA5_SPOPA|nr:LytTR family DNA-binding domain-containing protein [Sporosarcina pasteurii]MDS9471287.1 LytTR family DNA-binding domain-containing protein [Sporosarcina pasteurii]SUJ06831.1 Sensory transduction protein lytR [Sporosarcina pasteurii]
MGIDAAVQYVSILKEWLPREASVAVIANGRYLYYVPGMHDIRAVVGQSVDANSIVHDVLKKKSKVEKYMQGDENSSSYYGIGYPVIVDDIEGVLLVSFPPNHHSLYKEPMTFLTGRNEDCWHPIAVDKISHIESLQKKTWFYKNDIAYQSMYTLKDLIEKLPDFFLRIHRSYIVNIQHILEISRDFSSNMLITLKNGTVLPVSQSYSTHIRKKLGF